MKIFTHFNKRTYDFSPVSGILAFTGLCILFSLFAVGSFAHTEGSKDNDSAESYFAEGQKHEQTGNAEAAIVAYKRAIRENDHHHMAWERLAVLLMAKNELNNAEEAMNQVIHLNPSSIWFNNRGMIRMKQNQFCEAISDFDRAIEMDPANGVPYYNRGLAKAKIHDNAGAISDFQKASNRGIIRASEKLLRDYQPSQVIKSLR